MLSTRSILTGTLAGVPSIPAAGVTPASAFTLATHVPRRKPPAILAEAIGARSREVQSLTRSTGIADGMVSYLIGVQRGSGAAVRDVGHRLRQLRNVDDGTATSLATLVREALRPAVDSGTARIAKIEVEINALDPTQVDGRIRYRDSLKSRKAPDDVLTLEKT